MFKSLFDDIQKYNPDIHIMGIWGKDGLELEKVVYAPAEADIELLGAEIADVAARIDTIQLFSGGYCMEYSSPRFKVAVFSLTPNYFLLTISGEKLVSGKLKFYLDLYKDKLKALL